MPVNCLVLLLGFAVGWFEWLLVAVCSAFVGFVVVLVLGLLFPVVCVGGLVWLYLLALLFAFGYLRACCLWFWLFFLFVCFVFSWWI